MKRVVVLVVLIAVFLWGPGACGQELFDIKPVAEGVYAAISKPTYKVNCNAVIILLGDSVQRLLPF